jgi:hypothetical protein
MAVFFFVAGRAGAPQNGVFPISKGFTLKSLA